MSVLAKNGFLLMDVGSSGVLSFLVRIVAEPPALPLTIDAELNVRGALGVPLEIGAV